MKLVHHLLHGALEVAFLGLGVVSFLSLGETSSDPEVAHLFRELRPLSSAVVSSTPFGVLLLLTAGLGGGKGGENA